MPHLRVCQEKKYFSGCMHFRKKIVRDRKNLPIYLADRPGASRITLWDLKKPA